MINASDEKTRARAARDAQVRTKRRADQAQIVSGLQSVLESDEQLLGFTRGQIAGGLRGKLTVGFEALFAPDVNIGLTERRIILQHVQPESGKPNEILPHTFPLSELHSIAFSDIETFGAERVGRLNLRLFNDQHFRLRLRGADNVTAAETIAGVFVSLTSSRPKARTSPTQSVCPHCDHLLDRVTRFCPYCGGTLESEAMEATPEVGGQAQGETASRSGDTPDSVSAVATSAVDRPAREWAQGLEKDEETKEEDSPVETVIEETTADMTTEGHEAAHADAPAHSAESEGVRPL